LGFLLSLVGDWASLMASVSCRRRLDVHGIGCRATAMRGYNLHTT
jgi:hypothetical protein